MVQNWHSGRIVKYMHSGRIVFPAGAVGSRRPSGVDLQPYRTTTDGAPHYRLQPIDDHDENVVIMIIIIRADGGDGDESVPLVALKLVLVMVC